MGESRVMTAGATRVKPEPRRARRLERSSRSVGVLMVTDQVDERHGLDPLRIASPHLNRRRREIADTVTTTGALPEAP